MPVSEGPLSTERRRLIATGIAAAVVALFIGWAFGRAGPGTTATDDPNPSSSTTPTTTTPGDELGATVPVSTPTCSPPRLPSHRSFVRTRHPPRRHRLGGRSRPLASTSGRRHSTSASSARGRAAKSSSSTPAAANWRRSPPIPGSRTRPRSTPATIGSCCVRWTSRGHGCSAVATSRDWSRSATCGASTGNPTPTCSGASPSVNRWANRMQVSEIDHEGNETGIAFAVDSPYWIAAADAISGVVVYGAPGGTYHVGPDGAYRLTSGQVIALGSQKLLATDCGENLTCGLVVIDRATGEATPLIPTLLEPTHRGHVAVLRQPGELRLPNAHVIGLARQPVCTDHHERARPGLRRDRSHHRRVHPVRRLPRIGLVVVARQHRARCTSSTATSRSTTSTSGASYEVSQDVFPLQAFTVRP